MAQRRQVKRTGKNEDGDITKLCSGSGGWGSVSTKNAISQIEDKTHEYFVEEESPEVIVTVVGTGTRQYLRTTADDISKNNLDNLKDC